MARHLLNHQKYTERTLHHHGDLFHQVEQTLDLLLTKYLKAGITYERVQRVETFPVPEEALREAVINAIAHKDYAAANPIQISVYNDKLMLWNPGLLPDGWSFDHLMAKHASRPLNPDIANAFFRAAHLESWGRGIDLITGACREHGSPAPEFRWDSGLWVEFPFAAQVSNKTPVETPVEAASKTPDRILDVLKARPELTLAEVAKEIGKSLSAVERASTKLAKEGRIRRVGAQGRPLGGSEMNAIGQPERATQNRVIALFRDELNYDYLGDRTDHYDNSNIEDDLLSAYLITSGYSPAQISSALHTLRTEADNHNRLLYGNNQAVYDLLRYGVHVQTDASEVTETVKLIDWKHPEKNDFAIAEEVTLKGNHERRPDIVLYVNGIAIGVLELKNSRVSIGDGIRQSLSN